VISDLQTNQQPRLATGPNRFTIQLKFIYSILPDDVLLALACTTPASPTEESCNPAPPVRLQDFGTSPAHHRKKAKVKVRGGLVHQEYVEVRERHPGKPTARASSRSQA
jgi:hypothetical protein